VATRSSVLEAVADRLSTRQLGHPLRVGIEGICGAGDDDPFADARRAATTLLDGALGGAPAPLDVEAELLPAPLSPAPT
jgi:hypothetical protein